MKCLKNKLTFLKMYLQIHHANTSFTEMVSVGPCIKLISLRAKLKKIVNKETFAIDQD